MSKGPRMEKPIKQFIESCLRVDLQLKNGHRTDKTTTDLMNTVKVYMLLTMRKPLVQDMIFEKHLSSGLGEKGLARKSVKGSKRLIGLKLEYLYFTDLGLAYQKVYQDEVKGKGMSWMDFSIKLLKDNGYYYGLLEAVEDYKGCLNGVPVVSHAVPLQQPEREPVVVYEGSVGELREKANSLFKELLSVYVSMEKKSNEMIMENDMVFNNQNAVYDFMLSSHRKYFNGSVNNSSDLKKSISKAQQGFDEAFTILSMVESLHG